MDQALFLRLGAIMSGLAVALGAFGAHGLKARLGPDLLEIFETGVRYHFYHALALLALACAPASLWQSRLTGYGAWALTVGIVIFSGSLYLLAVTNTRWLGAITPIGGVSFLIGWTLLAVSASHVSR